MNNLPAAVKDLAYQIVRVSRIKRNVYPVQCATCIVTAVLLVLKETASRAPSGDVFVIYKNGVPIFSGDCTA